MGYAILIRNIALLGFIRRNNRKHSRIIMKIRTPKTFKAKVLQCTDLICAASRTYKNEKYKLIGINIDRYDMLVRSSTVRNIDLCTSAPYHWYRGTEYSLKDIDKGMFFNALIVGDSMQELFWSCVASEVLKRCNWDECFRQTFTIQNEKLMKHLGITL